MVLLSQEEVNFFKKILPPGHSLRANQKDIRTFSKPSVYEEQKEDKKNIGPYKKCL